MPGTSRLAATDGFKGLNSPNMGRMSFEGDLTSSPRRTRNLPPLNESGSMTARAKMMHSTTSTFPPASESVGHQALAAASVWLANGAREGKRSMDPALRPPRVVAGEFTAKSLKGMTQPARRLVAASGALTARELRKAGNEDVTILKPLNKEEKDMKRILEMISEKAAMKFGTVRAALRHLDADCDGTVDRGEVRMFFRGYDFPESVADQFFDHLDIDNHEEVPYDYFVNFLRPYLQGAVNGNPLTAKSLTGQGGGMDMAMQEVPEEDATAFATSIDEEFGDVLRLIGHKAREKFGNLQKAFRYVDGDRSGSITRSEMHYFFRAFNMPESIADAFHDRMDADGGGEVSFAEFYKCLSPYVQPDKVSKPIKVKRALSPINNSAPPSAIGAERERVKQAAVRIDLETGFLPRPTDSGPAYLKVVDQDFRTELRKLMQDIGEKLPIKFKHARDAFRCLDLERNGKITRAELQAFFRGFGHPEYTADQVFDLLLEDGEEEIDFKSFMTHFDPVLGPAFRSAKRVPLIPCEDPSLVKEVNDIAMVISRSLQTKYKNVQSAFRAVDLNKDGKVSLYEMQVFIKQFNLPPASADKFFKAMDDDNSGYILYDEFIQLFGKN